MKQNENGESPRTGHAPSGRHWWEDWDGQDSSVPEEPWEPDAIDLLLHPELAEDRTGEDRAGEDPDEGAGPEGRAADHGEPAPQLATGDGLTPEQAEARRRQGLTGPPKRTGTGFFYRNGDEIPPTHPDHGPMHLIPRQQDGSFAAYYYCSKEELACMANPAPPPRRHRRDGFSPERQEEFVRHLRDTGSMTDAAKLTGISRSTAYNLYNSPDAAAFRAAVDEALDATQGLLEATALERAIKGQEEIVYYKGRRVGVRWKYDNRLLMSLLRARNPLKYAPLNEIEGWLARRGIAPPADVEGALDRLAAAEAEWGRRLPGEPLPTGPALAASLPAPALLAHPEQASSEAERRVEACPERLPQAGSRRGQLQASISSTSDADSPAQASNLSTLAPESPAQASTSSTLQDEPAAQASNLSTSEAAPPGAADEPGLPIAYRPPPRPRIRLG